MITVKMDPDVVRWGLHHLYASPIDNASLHDHEAESCSAHVHEGYSEIVDDSQKTDKVDVESDEVIAHALQEEFLKVATAEASVFSDTWEHKQQASILTQDWQESTNSQEDADLVGTFGAIETDRDNFPNPPEMTMECSLDGEVGKRLNQMVPVRHVPRINSQIPTEDVVESDHQRLLDRLRVYDLVELKVKGDGNCQFRALSDQLYRSTEHHGYVRRQVVEQLKSYPDVYAGYVPMGYANYLKKMTKNGEWGDHVTLQAAADTYGVKMFVLTSFKDTCYVEILPRFEKSSRVICLSFWAEVHYNSIYPQGEFPALNMRRKRWRLFGF